MKKIISCIIIGILVLYGLGAIGTATHQSQNIKMNSATESPYDDELDQSMTAYDGTLPVGYAILGNYTNLSVAQSFIPQKEVLTRTQFLMAANTSTTLPCVVAIRDNLTGQNLAVVSVPLSEFPVVNGTPEQSELEWIDFNFNDIWVVPGQIYYIVVYTKNNIGNFYWIAGNGTNIYPNGTVYLSVDNGNTWAEFANADGCFGTYGLRETFLEVTMQPGLFKTGFTIKNIGNFTAWDVTLNFTISGGLIFIGGHLFNNFSELPPGEEFKVVTGFVLGFGKAILSVKVAAANVHEISKEINATIILFFILVR